MYSKLQRRAKHGWTYLKVSAIPASLSVVLSCLTTTYISTYVSNSIGESYTRKLENDKNAFTSLMQQKSSFDNTQNNIYTEVGIYTGHVIDGKHNVDSSKVQSAIAQTQLQLGELEVGLRGQNTAAIVEYSNALKDLRLSLMRVKSPTDLGSLYAALRKMLVSHDAIDAELARKKI